MKDDLNNASAPRRSLQIDVAKYQAMIDDPALSDIEKRQFVEALGTILSAFVDLGFELHESQIICGKDRNAAEECCAGAPDMIELSEFLRTKFESASAEVSSGADAESDDER